MTLQAGGWRDLNAADDGLPDGVHHGQVGDVVHRGLPGQDEQDISAAVVHQVVVSVVLVRNVHTEGVRAVPQTGLEPVAPLPPHVEVELRDVESPVVHDLDLVRPQLLQAGLVLLGKSVQEQTSRHWRVVGNENLAEVDREPSAPHRQPLYLTDIHRTLKLEDGARIKNQHFKRLLRCPAFL